MNKTQQLLSLLCLSLFFACQAPSPESTPSDEAAPSESANTSGLKSIPDIPYELSLPKGYEDKKDSLSLLVVLDGNEYGGIAQNTAVLYEFGEKIFPTVVLSIPSTAESRWKYFTPTKATESGNDPGNKALYAYTGQFQTLADYLRNELIPYIEKEYDIQFLQKSVFGHSMGGLAVLSFIVLQPDIFDHYISASPSTMYDDHYIFKTIEEKGELDFESLFLTAAIDDSNGYRENVNWLAAYLEKNKQGDQRAMKQIFEGETHGTSGIKSLIYGMEFIGKNR
ncbi:MAG: alpha/beta hydrolase-fold protein [Bacteroidota bacterium]